MIKNDKAMMEGHRSITKVKNIQQNKIGLPELKRALIKAKIVLTDWKPHKNVVQISKQGTFSGGN